MSKTETKALDCEHHWASRSVPNSKLVYWVEICSFCGSVNGKALDREAARAVRLARLELLNTIKRFKHINEDQIVVSVRWIESKQDAHTAKL